MPVYANQMLNVVLNETRTFDTSTTVDWDDVTDINGTKPDDEATAGAIIGFNLTGGFTNANVTGFFGTSTFNSTNVPQMFATAAIGDAYIGSLSATKITAGILNSNVINSGELHADLITTGTLNSARLNTSTIVISDLNGFSTVDSEINDKIPLGDAALDINNNATTITGGKITTGSIATSRITAGHIGTIKTSYATGYINAVLASGSTLTSSNSTLLTSVYYSNTSDKTVTIQIGMYGRTALAAGAGSVGFIIYRGTVAQQGYGWSPADQDARVYSFLSTVPANTAYTFYLYGAKSDAGLTSLCALALNIIGVANV